MDAHAVFEVRNIVIAFLSRIVRYVQADSPIQADNEEGQVVASYPNLYVMQSAPWYTELLLDGALVAVVVVVCIILKLIIWRKLKL